VQYILKKSLIGVPETVKRDARYSWGSHDLNGDGIGEAIIYLEGDRLCGTGGCDTTIVIKDDHGLRTLTLIGLTRPPIRVLDSSSRGWKDISVQAPGTGSDVAQDMVLSFDGNTYPDNPSGPPARRASGKETGNVIISPDQERAGLY